MASMMWSTSAGMAPPAAIGVWSLRVTDLLPSGALTFGSEYSFCAFKELRVIALGMSSPSSRTKPVQRARVSGRNGA